MKKYQKPLLLVAVVLDVGITVFLFVISIIMLATLSKANTQQAVQDLPNDLIGFLARHPLVYGLAFVVPLFVLLAANIIGLVIYVRKTTKKEPVKVNDLTEEQKEALRRELLNDLAGDEKKE